MRTSRLLIALIAALALLGAACSSDADDDAGTDADSGEEAEESTSDEEATDEAATDDAAADGEAAAVCAEDGPAITIGAQDFGESAILAEIYGQALAAGGCDVNQQALGGFRDIVFTSFESGEINFTAEYAASALEFLNGNQGEATGDIDETFGRLQTQLETKGLVGLTPSGAVDSNAFVVTADSADSLGLAAVSDLTDDLTLGGPPDCPENASCIPGLNAVYGIDLSANFTPLDGGGPLTVAALDGGEIDVAILFSTDGTIADKGWVVLDDDLGLINADNITPVASQELVDAHGDGLVALVDSISAALDTAGLTELNRQFGIDLLDADVVAKDWLAANGF